MYDGRRNRIEYMRDEEECLCDGRRNTFMRRGGMLALWEEEFMSERRRNPCVMGGGILV